MALFDNMALKATQGVAPFKYVGVIDDGGAEQGFLAYNTDDVLTTNAKFAVEYAFTDFVHIRSCHTNKYWSRSPATSNGNWIVAHEDKPVVDKKAENCTLFRIDVNEENKVATIYHVQTGRTVRILNDGSARSMFLTVDPAAKTEAVSVAVNYSFVVLPKIVAFKDTSGLFYKNYSDGKGDDTYARFSVTDIGDPNIVCETYNSSDGHIRIRAANMKESRMFWTSAARPEALIAWSPDNPDDINQMFDALMVNTNTIALRSRANNKFCVRADYADSRSPKDRLVAKVDTMLANTYLTLVEPVLTRRVRVYEFYVDKARIYNMTLLFSQEHSWDNDTDEDKHTGTANGTISTTKSRTYTNTITAKAEVKTSFKTGIPFIAEGKIEVSASLEYAHEWETSVSETQTIGDTFTVVLKPRKRTIARGVATQATCDVPFAYIQEDYPTDGGPVRVTKLKDGIFTGVNAYGFRSDVRYEDIPKK